MRFALVVSASMAASCGGEIDAGALGTGSSKAIGEEPASDPANTTTRSTCAPDASLTNDFESGSVDWGFANPGALQANTSTPIAGSTSLDIDLASPFLKSQARAYYTKTIAPSCAVSFRVSLRVSRLFTGGELAHVVRLNAPTASFSLVVGAGGEVTIREEKPDLEASYFTVGTIAANVATDIAVSIDLHAGSSSFALAPTGSELPATTPGSVEWSTGETFTGVQLGLWSASATSGVITLDDFSLQ